MVVRVSVKPELLRWARERAGLEIEDLSNTFPKIEDWEIGEVEPTLKQLEAFARKTYVPVGYFFLEKPPDEQIPIPDLRTVKNREAGNPSPNLLDTIHICQRRQNWYRDFAQKSGQEIYDFVGSANLDDSIEETARKMCQTLKFSVEEREQSPSGFGALRNFIERTDDAGVMVMVSGLVGSNAHRRLDVEEFRGFALSDGVAPLVFINGADSKAAQMFTLAHQLAHIWLNKSALTDTTLVSCPSNKIEKWCNKVSVEFLVPLMSLKPYIDEVGVEDVSAIAKRYKVSTLVVLRRLFDVGHFNRAQFNDAYSAELAKLKKPSSSSGGNFCSMIITRAGKRFVRDLVVSTYEGETSFIEAFRLLGIQRIATFRKIGDQLGIIT